MAISLRRLLVVSLTAIMAFSFAAVPAAQARTSVTAAEELRVLTPERVTVAWDCPAGYSCYYTHLDGIGVRWVAPGCGDWHLDRGEQRRLQNSLYSIYNRGSGKVEVYNRTGPDEFELKGWVYPGQRGNFHQNISADMVRIYC
ncbi:peptidase inhibitor family I36 protein [Actinoplanes sp. NPDC024001]|uniref:peptidase inhibitor family I36 protein n=1 Tax=Actinoplanes sp. NPDC024001 TaxID=3154598 RepID=UPI0033DE0491